MIGVVDYGLGNVQAFLNVYDRLGIPAIAVKTVSEFDRVKKLILPGVGAFDRAITMLNDSGLRESLDECVVRKGMSVLGICVGMQMMARVSAEGRQKGLSWINAEVEKFVFSNLDRTDPVPHMGWNDVFPSSKEGLFNGLEDSPRFYFLHSYYFPLSGEEVLATSCYGFEFASAVCSDNMYGVQFHPEKSHRWGMQLLKNFAQL
jgi:glutamine amidotransferase